MTRLQLLQKAKYVFFPYENSIYAEHLRSAIKETHISAVNLPILPGEKVLYDDAKNRHHYRNDYHFNYVLPQLDSLFQFGFDVGDFRSEEWGKEKIPCLSDEDVVKIYIPNEPPRVSYRNFLTGANVINADYIYLVPLLSRPEPTVSYYHNLYRGSHSCSRVINSRAKTEKKIMISGDSQMIPDIAPLSLYYKEVWYFDNRSGYDWKVQGRKALKYEDTKHISINYANIEFDDVLIALYCNPLDWYQHVNLM